MDHPDLSAAPESHNRSDAELPHLAEREFSEIATASNFSAERWTAITGVAVIFSAAIFAILELLMKQQDSGNWLVNAGFLAVPVVVALWGFRALLKARPLGTDGAVLAEVTTDEFRKAARRVEVVDARGVQEALKAGLIPVLRGDAEVTVHNGAIEVRDNASVVLLGQAHAVLRDRSSAQAKDNSYVVLHDRARVKAFDSTQIDAHDRTIVEAESKNIVIFADGSARVSAHGGTVQASGRAGILVTQGGTCFAAEEAVVVLIDGLVKAKDDARVLGNEASKGTVEAADRVVIFHLPGIRVVTSSPEVHVISRTGPIFPDRGPAVWFSFDEIADPAVWARAWRIQVTDGHIPLALDTGYRVPAIETGLFPTFVPEAHSVELPRRMVGFPLSTHTAMADDPGAHRYLVAWVPLEGITETSPTPQVHIGSIRSSGAAWLTPDGLPASAEANDAIGDSAAPVRLVTALPELMPGVTSDSLTSKRGMARTTGSHWTARWLPEPLNYEPLIGQSPWWDVVLPNQSPDGRAIVIDRADRRMFISGPPPPQVPRIPSWIAFCMSVAIFATLIGSFGSTLVQWLTWGIGTAFMSLAIVGHIHSIRIRWVRRRWWYLLAARYEHLSETPAVSSSSAPKPRRWKRKVKPSKSGKPRVLGVPSIWVWPALIFCALVCAVAISAISYDVNNENFAEALVAGLFFALSLAAIFFLFRPRQDENFAATELLPQTLHTGQHSVDQGTFIVSDSAHVQAEGIAHLVVGSGSPIVQANGCSTVDQRGGRVTFIQRAAGVIRAGFAECTDEAFVQLANGEVVARGEACVIAHGGKITAAESATVVVPEIPPTGALEIFVKDATVTVVGNVESVQIHGVYRSGEQNAVMAVGSDGTSAGLHIRQFVSGAKERITPDDFSGFFGKLVAAGLRPVRQSQMDAQEERVTVWGVDGRLETAHLFEFLVPPDDVGAVPMGKPYPRHLWFPGFSLLLESVTKRPGWRKWLVRLISLLAVIPAAIGAIVVELESDPSVATVVTWILLLSGGIVVATALISFDWLVRLWRRKAIVWRSQS